MLPEMTFTIESHDLQHQGPVYDLPVTEVWALQDPEMEGGKEYMFVTEMPDGKWKVCNVPFYVSGILAGAIVDVASNRQITRLASNPDESGRRIIFTSFEDKTRFLNVLRDLVSGPGANEMKGCLVEGPDPICLVVQVQNAGVERLDHMIEEWHEAGHIECFEDMLDGVTWPRSGIH